MKTIGSFLEENCLFYSLSAGYPLNVLKAPLKASSIPPLEQTAADEPIELRDRYPEHPVAATGARQIHRAQLARINQVRDVHHAHAQEPGCLLAFEQDRLLRVLFRIIPRISFLR